MECPACGHENPEGSGRCAACGRELDPPSRLLTEVLPERRAIPLRGKVARGLALVALLFGADSLFLKSDTGQRSPVRPPELSIAPARRPRNPPAPASARTEGQRPDRFAARRRFRHANTQFRRGDLEGALSAYREALALDPALLEARHNLAVVLGRLGRNEEAVRAYQEVLREQPAHALAHKNLGLAYQRLGRLNEALSHYQEAVRLRPNFASAHGGLASLHLQQGDLERAEAAARKALQAERGYAFAHYLLGRIYLTQGKRESAEAQVRVLQRLEPGYAGELRRMMQERTPREGGGGR